MVGAVAQCRDRLAVCNGVPRCSGRGASLIACGGRLGGGQPESLPTWRFGPPICTHHRWSLCHQRHSTPRPGQRICWTPPPPLETALGEFENFLRNQLCMHSREDVRLFLLHGRLFMLGRLNRLQRGIDFGEGRIDASHMFAHSNINTLVNVIRNVGRR